MIHPITIYFILGTLFTGFLDILGSIQPKADRFTNFERIMSILVWPILLVVFIYNFFKRR